MKNLTLIQGICSTKIHSRHLIKIKMHIDVKIKPPIIFQT